MGMIAHDPALTDDYSAEVIRLARERSPAIDAWIVEERYLMETVEDNLTPLWLRNRCIIKICEELAALGFVINRDPDVICDEPEMVYTVLMLRKKFDEENLIELFRDHRDLFDEVKSDLSEEVLENIVNWCGDNLALDEGWSLLKLVFDKYPGLIGGGTRAFLNLINRTIESVDMLGEPDATMENDQDTILRYIRFLNKRVEYIRQTAHMLWSNFGNNEFERRSRTNLVNSLIDRGFEKDLGSRGCLRRMLDKFSLVDLKDLDRVQNFLQEARAPYKQLWPNCLDYYVGEQKKSCADSMLAIILATLIVDCPHQNSLRSDVMLQVNEYLDQLGSEACEAIRTIFEKMLANLVNPLELNYAAE